MIQEIVMRLINIQDSNGMARIFWDWIYLITKTLAIFNNLSVYGSVVQPVCCVHWCAVEFFFENIMKCTKKFGQQWLSAFCP